MAFNINEKKYYKYHTTDINEAAYIYNAISDNILNEPNHQILIKIKKTWRSCR